MVPGLNVGRDTDYPGREIGIKQIASRVLCLQISCGLIFYSEGGDIRIVG
jgi:hypothetical protein